MTDARGNFLSLFFLSSVICNLSSICLAITQQESLEWLLLREDYETLGVRAEYLVKDSPRSEYLYLSGLGYLKSSYFDEAREQFELVIKEHPRSPEVEKALVGIADSFYLEGTTEKALEKYLVIERKYRRSSWIPYILYRIGECHQALGQTQEAQTYFNRVITQASRSPEAKFAAIRLKGDSLFSVQVGAFSDYQNAERMQRRLRSKGFQAYLTESKRGNEILYRVRVGQFQTQREARELEARLYEQGFQTKIYP